MPTQLPTKLTTTQQHICSAYAAWMLNKNKDLAAIVTSLRNSTEDEALRVVLEHWNHIGPPSISKCKAEGVTLGLIREVFDMDQMRTAYGELKQMVDTALFDDAPFRTELMRISGGVLKEVRVQPGASKFDEFCALQILLLMSMASTIGVMWGRMVRMAVDALVNTHLYLNLPKKLCCLPVSGEPTFMLNVHPGLVDSPADYSATVLAMKLAAKIRGMLGKKVTSKFVVPSLLGVPCYVGMGDLTNLSAAALERVGVERDKVLDRTKRYPGWQTIFGEKGSAQNIDMLITGVGHVAGGPDDFGMFIQERIQQEGVEPEVLQKLCHGDLAGTLLIKKGLSNPQQRLAEQLNKGWTGLKEADLRSISKKAPGVVLICEGANKAEVVEEAVRRGLVTRLICDRPLREALAKRLGVPAKRSAIHEAIVNGANDERKES